MKILYITTIGITMNFFKSIVTELTKEGHRVDIACNTDAAPVNDCFSSLGCNIYKISCSRSPFNKGNIRAIKEIRKLVKEGDYDIVHCHTPIAAACTRLACRPLRHGNGKGNVNGNRNRQGVRVIYTAHGFHFYKGAPLKNWLIFYPVEKLCSRWTDVQITINKEDFERAKKKLKAKETVYVPGVGIDVSGFKNYELTQTAKSELRKSIGVPENAKMILSVGELNENKNHEVVIRAIAALDEKKADIEKADKKKVSVYYCIAGVGDRKEYLERLASELGVAERVHLLGYRKDVKALYKCSDLYVHPSFREGLPVALIEAEASGLPCVCSKIRGNSDLVDDGRGGYLVADVSNPEEWKGAIEKVLNAEGKSLHQFSENNLAKIKDYSADSVNSMLMKIYTEQFEKKNKKVILHILNSNAYSGAENVALSIIKGEKEKYRCIYMSPKGSIKDTLDERGIECELVDKLSPGNVKKAVKKYSPDLIHAHDFMASVKSVAAFVRIPVISHLHNNAPWLRKKCIKSYVYLLASKRIKKILTVSDSIMDEYVFGNRLKKKTEVIGNPVDSAYIVNLSKREVTVQGTKYQDMQHQEQESDVAFFGRLSDAKNPEMFVEVVNKLREKKKDISAVMIGDGELRKEIEERIQRYGLGENIKLYGFLNNPYCVVSHTKVVCMPSKWEGFGLTAFESLALGKPVIASKVGGIVDIVDDECGGFCDSAESFSETIYGLLADERVYLYKSCKAVEKSKKLDNVEQYLRKIESVYED